MRYVALTMLLIYACVAAYALYIWWRTGEEFESWFEQYVVSLFGVLLFLLSITDSKLTTVWTPAAGVRPATVRFDGGLFSAIVLFCMLVTTSLLPWVVHRMHRFRSGVGYTTWWPERVNGLGIAAWLAVLELTTLTAVTPTERVEHNMSDTLLGAFLAREPH